MSSSSSISDLEGAGSRSLNAEIVDTTARQLQPLCNENVDSGISLQYMVVVVFMPSYTTQTAF